MSETRDVPNYTIIFDGMIYGRAGDGAVILDGATGEDAVTGIPGTFIDVNEHGAIMLIDGEVCFVPATA